MAQILKFKGHLYQRIDSDSLEHVYDEIEKLGTSAKTLSNQLELFAMRARAHLQNGNPKVLEEARKGLHSDIKKLVSDVSKMKQLIAKTPKQ